jgi:membrane protease YdiL (CAAX protease family)
MPDPTEIVLTASFLAALALFISSIAARKLYFARAAEEAPVEAVAIVDGSPYEPPAAAETPLPPALPVGKVPVWFYRPLDLLGLGLIYLVFFGLVIGSVRADQDPEISLNPASLITAIGFQFFLAGIAILMVVPRVGPVTWLGLKWRSWPWVFLMAPAAVVLMWVLLGALQATGYMEWIESLGVESVQDTVKLLQTSKDPTILSLMAFAAVVAAPICEEIVFRGYFYAATKRFAGPWVAGFISALVFASAHASLSALLPLFIFGCVLVFLYEKTGSLWAPIAVHFCFNGATVLVQLASRYYELPIDSAP